MNKLLVVSIISFLILFSLSCKKEKKVVLKPNNHLQEISEVELQTFELDTVSFSKIKGQNGTEIWFRREAFEVLENQKITVELKEFYSFQELILNNINTITDKGELLESSGVIYLDFIADGKSLKLKEKNRIGIKFPNNRLSGNNIYSGTVDSLNQFKWSEEEIFVGVMEFNQEYAIDVLKIIPRDSLEFYYDYIPETIPGETESDYFNITGAIYLNRFKWINIDLVTDPERLISFELIPTHNDLENLNVYFTYSDINSFVSNFRTIDSLVFEDIPIKNQTSLTVIGKSNDKFYMDNVNLSKVYEDKIDIDLKQTTLEEIKNCLKNNCVQHEL